MSTLVVLNMHCRHKDLTTLWALHVLCYTKAFLQRDVVPVQWRTVTSYFLLQEDKDPFYFCRRGCPHSIWSGKSFKPLSAFADVNESKYSNGPQGYTASCLASLPQQIAPAADTLPLFIFLLALLFSHGLHHTMQVTIPLPATTHHVNVCRSSI